LIASISTSWRSCDVSIFVFTLHPSRTILRFPCPRI
jgi:hypothetical protein